MFYDTSGVQILAYGTLETSCRYESINVPLTAAARSWSGTPSNATPSLAEHHCHHPGWALHGSTKITSQMKADRYYEIVKHMGKSY